MIKSFLMLWIGLGLAGTGVAGQSGKQPAKIYFQYDAATKAELIKAGYFDESVFEGNAVVAEQGTSLDGYRFTEEQDTTPSAICYVGTRKGARSILEEMLANTDGNGDHWLGDVSFSQGKKDQLLVVFTVIGEGGETEHSLELGRCK